MSTKPQFSLSLQMEPPDPSVAYRYFIDKLSFEADVADLSVDIHKGYDGIVVIDVRDEKSYEDCHIPTALSLPGHTINQESTQVLSKEKVIIVYCWGPACNGATRAAVKFANLGFRVKELIGGIEYWRKEGGEVEGTLGEKANMYWQM